MHQATGSAIALPAAARAENVMLPLRNGDRVSFGSRHLGCCDFQQGDAHTLWRSITGQLFTLPVSCLLYPGHDYTGCTVTSVAEEKAFNARLGGGVTERDFVGHMQAMKLPHPHKIAEALPGNCVPANRMTELHP
jgi:sulfur dioxygenase